MPFDFPTSPTVGQQSNGYAWDGEKWNGGSAVYSNIPAEQFLNMAGKTSIDIDVPTWARGAVIDGSLFMSVAAAYAALQVSVDGTTFYAGTSYQLLGGITHNVSGGYATQAAGASPIIYLSYPRTNLMIPHIFQCQLNLESNNTTQLIAARTETQAYDNTSLGSQLIWAGYLNVNLTPPARVQKLRVLVQGGGTFVNGYVKIKWLGDIAQVPSGITNTIVDAPSDGAEYVRRNGVWRLKSQTFIGDGAVFIEVPVPAGAKMGRFIGSLNHATAIAGNSVILRASLDGTNFLASATDYHYTGWIHYSGAASPGFATLGSVVGANCYLCFNNDAAIVPDVFDLRMAMVRPSASATPWYGIVNSVAYQTAAGSAYNNSQMRVGVMHTNAGSVYDLKKLRFQFAAGGNMAALSTVEATWTY